MARRSTVHIQNIIRINRIFNTILEAEARRFFNRLIKLDKRADKRIEKINNVKSINELKNIVSVVLVEQRTLLSYEHRVGSILIKALDKFRNFNPIKNCPETVLVDDDNKYHEYVEYSKQCLYLLALIAENSNDSILNNDVLKRMHEVTNNIESYYKMQFFILLEEKNKKLFKKFLSSDVISKQEQREILTFVEDYYIAINTALENSTKSYESSTKSCDDNRKSYNDSLESCKDSMEKSENTSLPDR